MRKIVRNLMLLSVATAMFTACGKEPEVTKRMIQKIKTKRFGQHSPFPTANRSISRKATCNTRRAQARGDLRKNSMI